MFSAEIKKILSESLSENFQFLEVKFEHLNRRVFIMIYNLRDEAFNVFYYLQKS